MSDGELPPAVLRRRSSAWLVLLLLVVGALVASACGGGAQPTASPAPEPTAAPVVESTIEGDPSPVDDDEQARELDTSTPPPTVIAAIPPTPHPIVEADTELPRAGIGFGALAAADDVGPQPVSLQITDIGVGDATIIPVGVNPDLSFEVPPAEQVGWYRFGPTPGSAGSAVLAAHIAYDGVDGVFRYLADAELGAIVEVGFDDGSSQRYRIEEITDYLKEELPASLWAETGSPQLALITCGGAFNPELRSYESNTVAIAVPI